MHARLLKRSPADRLSDGLRWNHELADFRRGYMQSQNPAASESEILALWTEETYRETVEPAFLARACAEIRRRGLEGAAPGG